MIYLLSIGIPVTYLVTVGIAAGVFIKLYNLNWSDGRAGAWTMAALWPAILPAVLDIELVKKINNGEKKSDNVSPILCAGCRKDMNDEPYR